MSKSTNSFPYDQPEWVQEAIKLLEADKARRQYLIAAGLAEANERAMREEGAFEEKKSIAKRLKDEGMSVEFTMRITDLSAEEIEAI